MRQSPFEFDTGRYENQHGYLFTDLEKTQRKYTVGFAIEQAKQYLISKHREPNVNRGCLSYYGILESTPITLLQVNLIQECLIS